MTNKITFTIERRAVVLLGGLLAFSLYANYFFVGHFFTQKSAFVPTYPVVKTIYDREQDKAYAQGYLMTNFSVLTNALFPEGDNEMVVEQTGFFAYNPDVWCKSDTIINREMVQNRCNKYWNK